jgi:hypothetical protein
MRLTACAFWMMKISTAMRTAVPAISPVRMLLVFVRIRLRAGACGAGTGGAEPLADGAGRVLVVPAGAAGSVMGVLPSSGDRGRRRRLVPVFNLHRNHKTSNIFLEIVV